jgi:death-on-curing protein
LAIRTNRTSWRARICWPAPASVLRTDIASLAATVLLAVAGNHPFLQGNKRTGFAAANLFLETNGYALTVEDSVDFARLIINVLEGKASEAHLAEVLRNGVAPVDD